MAAGEAAREPAAAASEPYLRMVMQNAPVVLLAFDREGVVTLHEGAVVSRFGMRPGELVGKAIDEVATVREGESDLAERVPRVLAGETFTQSLALRGRTLEVHHAPLRDAAGAIVGGLALGVDKTEQVRAEERFHRVVEHAADAIVLVDEALRYTYANEAACRIYGRPREELLGRTFRDFLHPDDVAALERFRETLRVQGVVDHVLRMVRPDGRVVPLESRTVALGDGGYHTSQRHMTPWPEAQRVAQESEAHLRTVLTNTPVAVLVLDAAGIVRTYDGALLQRAGMVDPSAYVGQHYTAIPSRAPDFAERMGRALKGETFTTEVQIGERTARAHHRPVRDEAGTIVGVAAVALDLTEEKQLEAQVQRAQRMEAVGTLAAGVSHDFNNLLTVVLANLDVAHFGSEEERRQALQRAGEAARSAGELSQQLLDIGRAKLIPHGPLPLAPLVEDVLQLLERSLPDNIVPEAAVDGALVALGDAGRLRQVLLNLALNAVDAMPNGGRLEVRAEPVATPPAGTSLGVRAEGYIRLAVSDQGEGMDRETLERMFDPFFTTKGARGTGLGSAVAYGIVREHGGTVTVESQLGVGTTVEVYLPAAAADAAPGAAVAQAEVAPGGPEQERTVLVVDDLAPLRLAARSILEQGGYRVLEAAGGAEALAILEGARWIWWCWTARCRG